MSDVDPSELETLHDDLVPKVGEGLDPVVIPSEARNPPQVNETGLDAGGSSPSEPALSERSESNGRLGMTRGPKHSPHRFVSLR